MFKFKNPALLHILLLFVSNAFNDFVVLNLHIPVSPTQLVIAYGMVIFYVYNPKPFPKDIAVLRNILYAYLVYVTISCVVVSVQQNTVQLNMVTIGANSLWLLGVIPLAYEGISESDMFKFFKTIIWCIVIFVAFPGLYEMISRHQIIKELEDDAKLFYLKGLTAEKLEFGNLLATGMYICMACLLAGIRRERRFFISALIFFSLLMTFSFSTTSILGAATGMVYLFSKRIKENKASAVVFAIIGLGVFFYLQKSVLFQGQLEEYNTKYTKNVDQGDDNNFRWLAVKAGAVLFLERPLVGYGANASGDELRKYLKKNKGGNSGTTLSFRKSVNSHNFFINEGLDYGLFGLSMIFTFVYIVFGYSFNNSGYTTRNHVYLFVLKQVCVCLSIYAIYRFILYYHRFDQTSYFIWVSFIVLLKGTEKKLKLFDARTA